MSGAWERNPIDLLIATPISGQEMVYYSWHERMMENVMNLPQGLKHIRARFPEPVIDISRDKAVQMAISAGAKWIWFIDSDVMPPPDALARLIAHDKPIVSALYVRRHNPPFNEMLRFRNDAVPSLRPIQDGEYTPGELVKCDAVATGCVLIKTEVFEKVKPFQVTIDGQPGRPAWFLWTEWRTLGQGYSEDFAFFTRASMQGVPVYCDTSIQCGHCGPIRFVPSGNNTLAFEFMG
ncbi:MAG TPA: hypothetical protein VJR06_01175 [Nitrososphaerales archaeon]|nr:hypothetical protein [Nitrososphaerales archaeon]